MGRQLAVLNLIFDMLCVPEPHWSADFLEALGAHGALSFNSCPAWPAHLTMAGP
jgi:hypothetical protein